MSAIKRDRYPFATAMKRLCRVLNVAPERAFKRVGMPEDSLLHEGKGLTARQYYDLWNAALLEADREDAVLYLARSTARATPTPTTLAFSSSSTLGTGFERLALFKPLVFPLQLIIGKTEEVFSIQIIPLEPSVPIPDTYVVFETTFLVEIARNCTNERIVPEKVSLPGAVENRETVESYLGAKIGKSRVPTLCFSKADAELPLISANEEMWEDFEPGLFKRLLRKDRNALMSARVRRVLIELLPSGYSSADAVCNHLHVSKRSLYRYLKNEGETFQSILDATRSELSLHYLSNDELSIDEISYLLAFRDPNSFYRAFRNWTGMTPMEARSRQQQQPGEFA